MSYVTPTFPADLENYAPWVAIHGLTAPYGECQCGCEEAAPIAIGNATFAGLFKGHPKRFIYRHSARHRFGGVIARFWSKVDKRGPDDCWLWQGTIAAGYKGGYGGFRANGKMRKAHRFSYELYYGPIPDGKEVCHSCDANYPPGDISYRRCCNPTHLFAGTHQYNMGDMAAKGRSKARPIQSYSMKLTEDQIAEVWLLREHGLTQREIARRYGVCRGTIGNLLQGKHGKSLALIGLRKQDGK